MVETIAYLCSGRWRWPSARAWSWLRYTSPRGRTSRRTGDRPAGTACTWSYGRPRTRRGPSCGSQTGRNRRSRPPPDCCWPRRRPRPSAPYAGRSGRTSWASVRTSYCRRHRLEPTAGSGSRLSRLATGSISPPPCRTSGSPAARRPTGVSGVCATPLICIRRRRRPSSGRTRPTAGTRCCDTGTSRRRRTGTTVPRSTRRWPRWWYRRTARRLWSRRARWSTRRLCDQKKKNIRWHQRGPSMVKRHVN